MILQSFDVLISRMIDPIFCASRVVILVVEAEEGPVTITLQRFNVFDRPARTEIKKYNKNPRIQPSLDFSLDLLSSVLTSNQPTQSAKDSSTSNIAKSKAMFNRQG